MPADTRNYSAASFVLELDGTAVGFLHSVEGGEPFAQIVNEPVDQAGVVKKHVGSVQFQPIVMTFGTGMGKPVYQWITETLARKTSAKNGAIIAADYNFKERYRLKFEKALITEITFPKLDGSAKDSALFTLTLQASSARMTTASVGTSIKGFATKVRKKWLASNFIVKISGLETASARINAVDAIVVKQAAVEGNREAAASLDIPNVAFNIPENFAKDFLDWADGFLIKGDNGETAERAGSIEFFDQTSKSPLFTLMLSNLGVVRANKLHSEAGSAVIARVGVELYCEQMNFIYSDDSVGTESTVATAPATTGDNTATVALTDTLIDIIAGRISALDALQATAKLAASSDPTVAKGSLASEVIARRLLATTRPVITAPVVAKREDGVSLGKKWATGTATIVELQQLAAVNQDDWSALKLESGHTLIDLLRDQGMIPEGADGPLLLERDTFVEGVVAGASQVLNDATPHLARLSPGE